MDWKEIMKKIEKFTEWEILKWKELKKEMSLCYEFEKWTMITFVLVSASLTVGLN